MGGDLKYLGAAVALFYWELWESRCHISRRVDTYELLDTEGVRQSITIDVNNANLRNMLEQRKLFGSLDKSSWPDRSYHLPLFILEKHPLFDVDFKGPDGRPSHLCRRYENINVSAHILMGLCISLGYSASKSKHEMLFQRAITFLGYERGSSTTEKEAAENKFLEAANEGIKGQVTRGVEEYLSRLQDYYIQCVDYCPSTSSDVGIVKFQVTKPVGVVKEVDSEVFPAGVEDKFSRLAIEEVPTETMNVSNAPTPLSLFLRRAGVSAPKFEIPVGFDLPNHLRIIAARGTSIDDAVVHVHGGTDKLFGLNDGVLVERHLEKASILFRDLRDESYDLLIKINARPDNFLYPAMIVSALQLTIVLIALFVGPCGVARNSIAFTGTSLIAPFITALFLARASEHEMISKILLWPRNILLSSSVSTVVSGVLLSVLPSSHDGNTTCVSVHEGVEILAFCSLVLTALMAATCIVLVGFIVWRYHRMRRVTDERERFVRNAVRAGSYLSGSEIWERDARNQRDVIDDAILFFIYVAIASLVIVPPASVYLYSIWLG